MTVVYLPAYIKVVSHWAATSWRLVGDLQLRGNLRPGDNFHLESHTLTYVWRMLHEHRTNYRRDLGTHSRDIRKTFVRHSPDGRATFLQQFVSIIHLHMLREFRATFARHLRD